MFGVEQGWHFVDHARVDFGGQRFGKLALAMPGEHNRLNALAAIAAANHAGVSPNESIAALASFQGVKRRIELRGEVAGVKVYDDFAHHPTAFAATVSAMRKSAPPGERILAVFEPRSNTMKLGAMRSRLAESFDGADRVYSYSGAVDWDVAAALQPLGERAVNMSDIGALINTLVANARRGDHIVIMSNGAFGGIHQRVLDQLRCAHSHQG